ncbi:MAG TPA: hypothetical protein VD931_04630 [Baekduia sp.]|nr:hypothetical protein [Baekduia sp.]
MAITPIPRLAVDAALRVGRLPASTAARLLRRGSSPSGAELAIDRVDATVRGVAGQLLRDEALQEDAQRRAAATDELERAARLRTTAEGIREEAELQEAEARERAERERQHAAEQAKARKQRAAERKQQQAQNARKTERNRKTTARETAERKRQKARDNERDNRLQTLERQEEALEEREVALRTDDEAQRLQDAAARAKEQRKS